MVHLKAHLPVALLLVLLGTVHIGHAWQQVPSSSYSSLINQLNGSNLGALLNNLSAIVQQIISAYRQPVPNGFEYLIMAVVQISNKKKKICRIRAIQVFKCPLKVTSVKCYDCKFSKSSCSSTKVWKPKPKNSNMKPRDILCD